MLRSEICTHKMLEYAIEDQATVLEAAACLMAAAAVNLAKKKLKAKKKRKRRMWVRNWLLKRPKFGMYEKLMKHLRDGDTKSFRNFVRLGPEMFNKMVQELTPKIEKRRTPYREPLSTGLKLAVTLRYLATRDSYRSLSYGFRVAANTLVTVIPEVCQAIFDHYITTKKF